MENNQEKLTAAQRLERLEQSVFAVDQTLGGISQMADITRHATRLLGRKVEAIVNLSEKGAAITNENINLEMENQNISEMKDLVEEFKTKGTLVTSETVTPDSFLVIRETNSESGKTVQPRLQFPFVDLTDDLKSKLLGQTAGTVLKIKEPFDTEILEIYKIVEQNTSSDSAQATGQLN